MALSEKEKLELFQKTSANGQEVVKQAKMILERKGEKEDYFDDQGSFLPLSVWVAQGYDATAIAANTPAKDQKVHPVLGLVYRVPILTTGNRGAKGTKEVDVIGSRAKMFRIAIDSGSKQATPTEPKQEEKEDASDSTSLESFGSSSSSSSHAKTKKQQKKTRDNKKHSRNFAKKKQRTPTPGSRSS